MLSRVNGVSHGWGRRGTDPGPGGIRPSGKLAYGSYRDQVVAEREHVRRAAFGSASGGWPVEGQWFHHGPGPYRGDCGGQLMRGFGGDQLAQVMALAAAFRDHGRMSGGHRVDLVCVAVSQLQEPFFDGIYRQFRRPHGVRGLYGRSGPAVQRVHHCGHGTLGIAATAWLSGAAFDHQRQNVTGRSRCTTVDSFLSPERSGTVRRDGQL